MSYTVDLPCYVADVLNNEGISACDITFFSRFDRDHSSNFTDGWCVITSQGLFVLEFSLVEGKALNFKGTLLNGSEERNEIHGELIKSKLYHFREYGKLFISNLIASGELVISGKHAEGDDTSPVNEKSESVAVFTNLYMKDMVALIRCFDSAYSAFNGGKPKEEEPPKSEELFCPKCGRMYPDAERKVCPHCEKKMSTFIRLAKRLPAYKWYLIGVICFAVLNTLLSFVTPYVSGTILFDKVLFGMDGEFWAGRLGLAVVLWLSCYALSLLFGMFTNLINARLSANVVYDLKCEIFSCLQRLSLSFFLKKQTGQLMNKVNNDAMSIMHFFIDGLPYVFTSVLNIFGGFIIMMIINWRVTLFAILPVIILGVLSTRLYRMVGRLYSKMHVRNSKMYSTISDSLKGTKVIKVFGKEQQEIQRFSGVNRGYMETERKLGHTQAWAWPLISLIAGFSTYLVWVIGGMDVINGVNGMSYGVLVTMISYVGMMIGPVAQMSNVIDWFSNCMNAAQRMFIIMDAIPEVKENDDSVTMDEMEGNISIENVSFEYDINKPILKNISFDISSGEMLGIVGHSGAGKSTLVNLVSRLYDVTAGRILIDGVDIKNISMSSLKKNIATVSQETYIFVGTVYENIAYARPDASFEVVIRAAKIANAHDFIEGLPEGYDTMVGTGYRALSGGEKQRISISRAVLVDPKILILDEATASLDTETEMSIQEALEKLIDGRTTIAIAHRLSTLRNADRIAVVEHGEVVEIGTHAELVNNKGIYFGLIKKQAEALKMKGV
ncbi:MAG: ABC transporter ATP-binding protein [Clostridiales bacterium]|nr:ABC transporter ATP-binding protein [Clostridiales bacterium]